MIYDGVFYSYFLIRGVGIKKAGTKSIDLPFKMIL